MSKLSAEPTQRFSARASAYAACRPGYPEAVFQFMSGELGLKSNSLIADIGAGTGILARQFLQRGNPVWCVEPNASMREHAQALLAAYPHCEVKDGTAEETGLPPGHFDFIVAGQAFHWFKLAETRAEFARIARPDGWIVLIWNQRAPQEPGFLSAYEGVLEKFNIDYQTIKAQNNEQRARVFFAGGFQRRVFANPVSWDFEHVSGYLFSASYMPLPGAPESQEVLEELRKIFDQHQQDGKIQFSFATEVIWGRP